jgi:hypothetical protein
MVGMSGRATMAWALWAYLAGIGGCLTWATVAVATGTWWGVAALLPFTAIGPAKPLRRLLRCRHWAYGRYDPGSLPVSPVSAPSLVREGRLPMTLPAPAVPDAEARFADLAAAVETLALKWDAEAGEAEETLCAEDGYAQAQAITAQEAARLREHAAGLRALLAGAFPDYEPPSLMCAVPETCPRGPAPHPYYPPADTRIRPCTAQPWQETVLIEDTHLSRMMAVVIAKLGGDVTVTLAEYEQGAHAWQDRSEPGTIRLHAELAT